MTTLPRHLSRLWLLGLFLLPGVAEACSVCYGDPESSLTKGMRAGVIVLLGVVVGVLGGIASFFYYLARKNRLSQGVNMPAAPVENAEKV